MFLDLVPNTLSCGQDVQFRLFIKIFEEKFILLFKDFKPVTVSVNFWRMNNKYEFRLFITLLGSLFLLSIRGYKIKTLV